MSTSVLQDYDPCQEIVHWFLGIDGTSSVVKQRGSIPAPQARTAVRYEEYSRSCAKPAQKSDRSGQSGKEKTRLAASAPRSATSRNDWPFTRVAWVARSGPWRCFMQYLKFVPKHIPPDTLLVHNSVYPVARRGGERGSRFWLQASDAYTVRCDCGWASELPEHYRAEPGA
jgi:hypothetical protein